jgi:hypothetical protein
VQVLTRVSKNVNGGGEYEGDWKAVSAWQILCCLYLGLEVAGLDIVEFISAKNKTLHCVSAQKQFSKTSLLCGSMFA